MLQKTLEADTRSFPPPKRHDSLGICSTTFDSHAELFSVVIFQRCSLIVTFYVLWPCYSFFLFIFHGVLRSCFTTSLVILHDALRLCSTMFYGHFLLYLHWSFWLRQFTYCRVHIRRIVRAHLRFTLLRFFTARHGSFPRDLTVSLL